MNKLIGALVLLLLVGTSGTGAQAGAWCAFYDLSTYNCGFHTHAQCRATISGVGGWCAPNHFEGYSGQSSTRGKARPQRR